jgi:uncharacterized protein (DUF305 family)
MLRMLLACSALLTVPAMVHAQQPHQQHGAPIASEPLSTRAFKAANERMHRDMAIRYTGNADRDFATSMIAHHQGAIDMAKAELQHGSDPEIRKLAQDVIAAQEKEIALMKTWLARPR